MSPCEGTAWVKTLLRPFLKPASLTQASIGNLWDTVTGYC